MLTRHELQWLAASAACAWATYNVLEYVHRRLCWYRIGHVSAIHVYPLKSGSAQSVTHAIVTRLGVRAPDGLVDRHFLLVDANSRHFITARQYSSIVLVRLAQRGRAVTMSIADDRDDISVKIDDVVARGEVHTCTLWENVAIDAYDCGDEASDWLRRHVFTQPDARRVRLMYHNGDLTNHRTVNSLVPIITRDDKAVFADLSPFMFACNPSLRELNTRLKGDQPVPMVQLRPNIVVDGPFDAYEEDSWAQVCIGRELYFTNIKPCTRCVFTTINATTGERDKNGEPLKTLKSYRMPTRPRDRRLCGRGDSPMFGINLAIDSDGEHRIDVGDDVYVRYM